MFFQLWLWNRTKSRTYLRSWVIFVERRQEHILIFVLYILITWNWLFKANRVDSYISLLIAYIYIYTGTVDQYKIFVMSSKIILLAIFHRSSKKVSHFICLCFPVFFAVYLRGESHCCWQIPFHLQLWAESLKYLK